MCKEAKAKYEQWSFSPHRKKAVLRSSEVILPGKSNASFPLLLIFLLFAGSTELDLILQNYDCQLGCALRLTSWSHLLLSNNVNGILDWAPFRFKWAGELISINETSFIWESAFAKAFLAYLLQPTIDSSIYFTAGGGGKYTVPRLLSHKCAIGFRCCCSNN